ncbi:unnamed protein product, partial [Vitis vinifera]
DWKDLETLECLYRETALQIPAPHRNPKSLRSLVSLLCVRKWRRRRRLHSRRRSTSCSVSSSTLSIATRRFSFVRSSAIPPMLWTR